MKIAVINGSPKGEKSITLQTILYLQKLYPQHEFCVFHVAQRIRQLEKGGPPQQEYMGEVLEGLKEAELLLFSYPVYTFLVPSQLHRFLELLKEWKVDLRGKYATQFSTSKHFYDVTAHRFLAENCQDLGLRYIRGLSADMEDLTKESGQREARKFWEYVCWAMETGQYERPVTVRADYRPQGVRVPRKTALPARTENNNRVTIVTDARPEDLQIRTMIRRFQAVFPYDTQVVNIREFPMKGGCLGCLNCTSTGVCIYKDGFSELLRERIQTGQATVYAFTIRDHSMGALFKQYDDRQFCNGHRTVTMGSPVGYLVSGPYAQEENLRMVIEARAETGGNFLAGVACDERDPEGEIDRMAAQLAYALEHAYNPPKNFYGVGGTQIFRDLVYLMQGMMRADHRFFKQHGMYDFPQKKKGTILLMYLVGMLFANEKLKKKLGSKIDEGMLAPYKKVLENTKASE